MTLQELQDTLAELRADLHVYRWGGGWKAEIRDGSLFHAWVSREKPTLEATVLDAIEGLRSMRVNP
jgi:hypothetical protein